MNTSAAQKIFWFTLLFIVSISICQAQNSAPEKPASAGILPENDSALDKLISPDAEIEIIARGYGWAEGLVWLKNSGCLVFSDVRRSRLYAWKEGYGVRPFPDLIQNIAKDVKLAKDVKPRRFSVDGMTLDAHERIVLAGHADRRITRIETNLTLTTLVRKYQGKRFNSPNDVIYTPNGDFYFTDPPYGLIGKNDSLDKELPFNGVYRLTANGELTLLIKDLVWPNGLALSPDAKTLYVANADPQKAVWMAYPVKPDGTLDKGRVMYDVTSKAALDPENRKGLPNGMEVDKDGNIFATGPGGLYVFNPAGKFLGMIPIGPHLTNCTFGDDGSTLYISTAGGVCRIKTSTKGLRFYLPSPIGHP